MNASDARLDDKEEVLNSLRKFKSRRDDLLHEDVSTFNHHFERFLEYCAPILWQEVSWDR